MRSLLLRCAFGMSLQLATSTASASGVRSPIPRSLCGLKSTPDLLRVSGGAWTPGHAVKLFHRTIRGRDAETYYANGCATFLKNRDVATPCPLVAGTTTVRLAFLRNGRPVVGLTVEYQGCQWLSIDRHLNLGAAPINGTDFAAMISRFVPKD